MIVNLAALLVLSHFQDVEKFDSKELDPKTRPIVEVPEFKDLACVTVSAYRAMNTKTNKLEVTRVYRFSYPADFKAEAKKWAETMVKQGRILDKTSLPSIIYERKLKHPKVVRQVLLLNRGKATFDSKLRARTKATKEDGWVWVSFNETIKDTSW